MQIYPHDMFYRRVSPQNSFLFTILKILIFKFAEKVSRIDEIFNALYLVQNDVIKVNSNEMAINYLVDTTSFFNVRTITYINLDFDYLANR